MGLRREISTCGQRGWPRVAFHAARWASGGNRDLRSARSPEYIAGRFVYAQSVACIQIRPLVPPSDRALGGGPDRLRLAALVGTLKSREAPTGHP